jgi:MoxR-like ATPase
MSRSDRNEWTIINAVLPVCDRALLYGPPGTGKTYAAQHVGVAAVPTYNLYLTEYTPLSEIRGSLWPMSGRNGQRILTWIDGAALQLYEHGGRLVLNEINQASDDCVTFLLAMLDDREVSQITLPPTIQGGSPRIIRPHRNFTVVATMNCEPEDLLPALRDRFPVSIRVSLPNPDAVSTLALDLQPLTNAAVLESGRAIGMRQILAYESLRARIDPLIAASACFGDAADEVLNVLTMADTRESWR